MRILGLIYDCNNLLYLWSLWAFNRVHHLARVLIVTNNCLCKSQLQASFMRAKFIAASL